jgi:DNA modification methylase
MNVVFRDPDVTLYQGDAYKTLADLHAYGANFKVEAVVTSPPYLDARDDVDSFAELHRYLEWASPWLLLLAHSVVANGSLMLNVGRLHRDGEEIPFADELRQVACASGWRWFDTLVWHKVNGGGGKASPYLLDRHEYVLWLVEGRSGNPYTGFDEARQPYSPATLARYTRRWGSHGGVVKGKANEPHRDRSAHPGGALPGSVFTSSVGAEKGIGHPTPMALDLALHLIRLSCPPGGRVLDPFAGSGTTGVAARLLGRRAVLSELDEGHCQEAAARLGQQTLDLEGAQEHDHDDDDEQDHEQRVEHGGVLPGLADTET